MSKDKVENISIAAPNIQTVQFKLVGTAPLVINRFGAKAELIAAQQGGSTSKKGKKKEAKNFERSYENAKHKHADGWCGIHAGSFRAAMISACRLVGFKMTLAKLSVFVLADGFSADGEPLVRIDGEPEMVTHHVRNQTGVVDVRARPMWKQWSVTLRIRYDADQFTTTDVANLLLRVGEQVGVGEGRPDSKQSAGMGWGTFTIDNGDAQAEAAE